MSNPKILIQLDTDRQVSTFDSVVAVDAGVDHLFRHANVDSDNVRGLVHGAIFTRGPETLKNTAIFVGGSEVASGEALLEEICKTFFGPVRVSVMIDSGGCNTTATAAVLAAASQLPIEKVRTLVLAATGPVGSRVCRLLARQGGHVRVASRARDRAEQTCDRITAEIPDARLEPVEVASESDLREALDQVQLVFCAGAAGIELLPAKVREEATELQVVIDLNAVPPLGVEGIEVHDRAKTYGRVCCYGAVGVGGTKIKIHKAAIRKLFEQNDLVLDAEEIFEIGQAVT